MKTIHLILKQHLFFILIASILIAGFSTQVQAYNHQDTQSYIIVFKSSYIEQLALQSNNPDRKTLIEQLANHLIEEINSQLNIKNSPNKIKLIYSSALQGFSADLTPQTAELLKQRAEIEWVTPDQKVKLNSTQSTQENASWGLDRIDQMLPPYNNQYRYLYTGNTVHAYIIDSGIRSTHSEFTGRIGEGYDVFDNDNNPEDCDGHGTAVTSILGGRIYGAAKKVTIHSIKMEDCNGNGKLSHILNAIDWINKNHKKPAVVNMSVGLSSNDGGLLNVIIRGSIINHGIHYVVAAGNNSADACNQSPASVPEAITVGSINRDNHISDISNKGPCVDIFAPGGGGNMQAAGHLGDYDSIALTTEGTSISAPYVAGVVAMYLEKYPQLSPAKMKEFIIHNSAKNLIQGLEPGTPNRLLQSFEKLEVTMMPNTSPVKQCGLSHYEYIQGVDIYNYNDSVIDVSPGFSGSQYNVGWLIKLRLLDGTWTEIARPDPTQFPVSRTINLDNLPLDSIGVFNMRVAMKYKNIPNEQEFNCAHFLWGDVKDYAVQIKPKYFDFSEKPGPTHPNLSLVSDSGHKQCGKNTFEHIKSVNITNNLITLTPGFQSTTYPEGWLVKLQLKGQNEWIKLAEGSPQKIEQTINLDMDKLTLTTDDLTEIHTMRIAMVWDRLPNETDFSCQSAPWGEVIDYSVKF